MFDNRFLKKDPLVEAVMEAQKDGQIRRDAVAFVNEQFGVYSRNAVIRENLSAYDAAVEEAYTNLKEGKWEGSKEDKDEDAKLAKKHGMTMAQWEKSAADKKHDAKEKIDEVSKSLAVKTYLGRAKKNAQDWHDLETDDSNERKSNANERRITKKFGKKTADKASRIAMNFFEETKLAKKDYDKDGKVESPKDEVWGSRLRAAKLAGKLKEEEQIDEISKDRAYSFIKRGSKDPKREKSVDLARDKLHPQLTVDTPHGFGRKRKAKVAANEETDYSAQDRAPVTKSAPKEDPSTPKSYPGAASTINGPNPTSQRMSNAVKENVTAPKDYSEPRKPNKGAVTKAPVPGVSIAEAAYSAKAARAGKDIGKPGKTFSKIAAKAGKKYGSEERGKKVAGAILAKIRAKHMKENTDNE